MHRENSNRAGNTIFDDIPIDEFVDGGNGNMMFDDEMMADDNCFLSPARDFNNDLLGMNQNNMDNVLNPPQ